MSRDAPLTVTKLLLLAADGANQHESIAAALKAAQLFKEQGLAVNATGSYDLECIMCQPATRPGQCYRCGLAGHGPGHACANPHPGTLCKVHSTWSKIPTSNPWEPTFYGPFGSYGGGTYGGSPSRFEEELRSDLSKARIRAAKAEQELEDLREELAKKYVFSKEQEAHFFLEIEDMSLSARALHCLQNGDLDYAGQLVQLTRRELLRLKNMGKKTVKEIEERLAALGLPPLGTKIHDWSARRDRWNARNRCT